MKFKNSPYYDKKFLGKHLYQRVSDNDVIFTIQEFFSINNTQNEYHIKETNKDYSLKIYEDYYELDCKESSYYLFLVFDKPVHVTGICSKGIIAPEIVVKSINGYFLSFCVAEKVIIDNKQKNYYEIINSKFNNTYFYNSKIKVCNSEINNLFIFNQHLYLYDDSKFLNYHKIKCFGECADLKEKILNDINFKQGIIHIE